MNESGNPKFEAWLEVEEWLREEAEKYDAPELRTALPHGAGLDMVADSLRNLLQGLANRAAKHRLEAGRTR